MPPRTRSLTLPQAAQLIRERAFAERTGERVGLELEWLTTSPDGAEPTVKELGRLVSPLHPLPARSSITFEPGGQIEISTTAHRSCSEAVAAARTDAAAVRRALREAGIETTAVGMDPARSRVLRTNEPRYVAMRAYFDALGPDGGSMMCTTASEQINVDAGSDAEGLRRWRLANRLGPTLVAAFANSPFEGYRSARMAAWMATDPTRTAPVSNGANAFTCWTDYVLDARVMLVRESEGFSPVTEPLSFRRWIDEGHRGAFPDEADLSYHLTTLFPPVRPRGWLEIRMVDMLPDPWWQVPALVVCALLHDEIAGAEAEAAVSGAEHLWLDAARDGLGHPALERAARACFAAALGALERGGYGHEEIETVTAYRERFVDRGRCPAEEPLETAEAI